MKRKKIIFIIILIIILIIGFIYYGKNNNKTNNTIISSDTILKQTYEFSQEYIYLRYRTDEVLRNAVKYDNYEDWNKEMTNIIKGWEKMESDAIILGNTADDYIDSVAFVKNMDFINSVRAYTREEISNVFDKAPAGKKIRTLAKYLGVDAKRAYKILKNDQEMVKAEAWEKAGDTFQKLETSAVVIKDGCKVAGFVGGVVISGGAAGFASAGMLGQATVVVGGADLVLEVSDDAATIALGNGNKVSSFVGDIRKVTEPTASILTVRNMPGNLEKGFDKFGALMFGADQLRSVVQEGKLCGVSISSDGNTHISSLDKEELKKWLKDQEIDDELDDKIEDLMKRYERLKNKELEEETDAMIKEYEDKVKKELNDEMKEINKDNEKKNIDHDIEAETGNESTTNNIYGEKKSFGKNGIISVSITSPQEATFQEGQARLWTAKIENFEGGDTVSFECEWSFYLDGEEVWNQKHTCKFTSSPIKDEGSVKATVKVKFTDNYYENGEEISDVIDTITAERFYESLPTPVDNYVYGE